MVASQPKHKQGSLFNLPPPPALVQGFPNYRRHLDRACCKLTLYCSTPASPSPFGIHNSYRCSHHQYDDKHGHLDRGCCKLTLLYSPPASPSYLLMKVVLVNMTLMANLTGAVVNLPSTSPSYIHQPSNSWEFLWQSWSHWFYHIATLYFLMSGLWNFCEYYE